MRDKLVLIAAASSFPITMAAILAHKLGILGEMAITLGIGVSLIIVGVALILAALNIKKILK
jgi:uncharacterized membrane protein YdfJ with MMPL/SSD domain